jgi:hypothetical protein
MVGLSIAGVLVGLVPPLALGVLVNALVDRNDRREAALLAVLIALATLVEAGFYVASDGLYARNASRLYRNLRLASSPAPSPVPAAARTRPVCCHGSSRTRRRSSARRSRFSTRERCWPSSS